MTATTVHLVSLGCARNDVDSEELAGRLAADGWDVSASADGTDGDADVVVVNTCTFVEQAKKDSIDVILEAAEAKETGRTQAVVAVGCLAQRYGTELAAELPEAEGLRPVVGAYPVGEGRRQFVDFQNDVTVKDIRLSAQEGFRSVEHMKRYTTLGMATDQGKTSNVPGLAIMAEAAGKPIPAVGTTRFRAPFAPVSLGSVSAERYGDRRFDSRRKALQCPWHMQIHRRTLGAPNSRVLLPRTSSRSSPCSAG